MKYLKKFSESIKWREMTNLPYPNKDRRYSSGYEIDNPKRDGFGMIINYSHKWKAPGSKIREEIENDVEEMGLEINDLGYEVSIEAWGNPEPSPLIRIEKWGAIKIEEIQDFIDRLEIYFKEKGFSFDYIGTNGDWLLIRIDDEKGLD